MPSATWRSSETTLVSSRYISSSPQGWQTGLAAWGSRTRCHHHQAWPACPRCWFADLSVAGIAQRVLPSVVSISTRSIGGSGTGSGFVDLSPTAFSVSTCGEIYISGWGGIKNRLFRQYCWSLCWSNTGIKLCAKK